MNKKTFILEDNKPVRRNIKELYIQWLQLQYGNDLNIHEMSANHFKVVSVSLIDYKRNGEN